MPTTFPSSVLTTAEDARKVRWVSAAPWSLTSPAMSRSAGVVSSLAMVTMNCSLGLSEIGLPALCAKVCP